jgi:hypothetical protein
VRLDASVLDRFRIALVHSDLDGIFGAKISAVARMVAMSMRDDD